MTSPAHPTRHAIETEQLALLNKLLAALQESNTFYGDRLRAAGLADPVHSLDEFTARMPLTTKQHLIDDQQQHPPYGTNLTYPIERYTRLHQTSSTTGSPVRWLDDAASWDALVDDWVTILQAAGTTEHDRLFAAFSFGPFIGFWIGFEAALRLGCLAIPGGAMNSITRLRVILANDVTIVCCTPTYALRLAETAREEHIDLSGSAVQRLIVAGEPGGSVPAVRKRIEQAWGGARVFDHHGMTEIGPATYQCPDHPGTLHLLEASLLCEFLDPSTGQPVEETHDGLAELVVTTLRRTGSPLLRYRTGDLVHPGKIEQCSCGRWERALPGGVVSRADDMVFVRGVNLYPGAIEQIVSRHPEVAEYRVEVSEHRGMTELRMLIESASADSNTMDMQRALADDLRSSLNLRIPIEVVPADTLPRFEFKARRWVKVASSASS